MTCYLLMGPIALPFGCSEPFWWTVFIGGSIIALLLIIAHVRD